MDDRFVSDYSLQWIPVAVVGSLLLLGPLLAIDLVRARRLPAPARRNALELVSMQIWVLTSSLLGVSCTIILRVYVLHDPGRLHRALAIGAGLLLTVLLCLSSPAIRRRVRGGTRDADAGRN